MKRDILFLCQFFYPEYNSSATLPFDTARHLAQSGYSVGALCGYPREYNTSGEVPVREMKDGVSIRRLHYMQLNRRSKLGRLINYFSFTLSVLLHILEIKDYQAVIVYSNPPVLPIAAIWANRLFKTKIIFVSYDVYPEVAYASGSLREGSTVSSVMQRINRSLFQRAESVVALTDEMREYLLDHRPELSADRIVTISNWAHEATAGSKSVARAELGYTDEDFIVAYFGNIGICQDETALIQAMDQLADYKNIKFLIAGHGNKMPSVRQAAERLPNVRICDFLTGTAFEHAVAASSCGIVSLEQGLTGMCAPSKYYSYLQGGLPILAVAEQNSYLSKEALHSEIGLANHVKKAIFLSTDKAAYPINAMGMTKAVMEKNVIARSRQMLPGDPVLCLTRYGNVMASRGSVIPLFCDQIDEGKPLTITNPNMTRFMMTLSDAVDLVLYAFEHGEQGDLFVQKAPAATIETLARAVLELKHSDLGTTIIGTRHGEKLFEVLVTAEEMMRAEDLPGFFRIPADNRDLNYDNYFSKGNPEFGKIEQYTSHNTHRLNVEEMKQLLLILQQPTAMAFAAW